MTESKNKGGRPKGRKNDKTLAKEAAREALRAQLTAEMGGVAEALVSRCKGVRYFVTRTKAGKYEMVTNPKAVLAALNKEDDYTGEFYTEKPETAAIKEFFDRTVDQAPKPVETLKLTGEAELLAALLEGRARVAKAKP